MSRHRKTGTKEAEGTLGTAEHSDRNTIAGVQERYAIVFTEAELFLLGTQDALLSPIQRQQRFILRTELRPIQCPACLGETCRTGSDTGAGDKSYFTCNRCGADLFWHLGFIDGWEWFTLRPGQTITVPPFPPAPRPGHRAIERKEEEPK